MCQTDTEILFNFFVDSEEAVTDWFFEQEGCQWTATAISALTGAGAARVAARHTVRKLVQKVLKDPIPEAVEKATKEYNRRGVAATVLGLLGGFVIGYAIEDWICENLEQFFGHDSSAFIPMNLQGCKGSALV